MIVCCREDNDLLQVLRSAGYKVTRVESLQDAMSVAETGDAVLALADEYPRPAAALTQEVLDDAAARGLHLYVEYPEGLPGTPLLSPQPAQYERIVVTSKRFAPHVAAGTILVAHGSWYVPFPLADASDADLTVCKVAGYRSLAYDLPQERHPVLFRLPESNVWIAATKLSQFIKGRYQPTEAWQRLWNTLLPLLAPNDEPRDVAWTPAVSVTATRDDALPPSAERTSFDRSLRWFKEHVLYTFDGKRGALEGYVSAISHTGRQSVRPWQRSDCFAESSMVLGWDWHLNGNPESRQEAAELLDTVWTSPDFVQMDPQSPAYGLSNWYDRCGIFYGDDNARVLLGSMMTQRLVDDGRWDEPILRCALANLRTTGSLGFRRARIAAENFPPNPGAWRTYYDQPEVRYAPHYSAYLWAVNLWVYGLTGDERFFTRTENAIRMTMAAYPNWRWAAGMNAEIARMLLPLAFLVRVRDCAEYRDWLSLISDELLHSMQPCGAIQEKVGSLENGSIPPPRSNADYGKREATIIQQNGDPAADFLYTCNFAFLGLHEAAMATGDAKYFKASAQLADLFCRSQLRSAHHPYLDGVWMRSFDYQLWEYWGSSADAGWGPWCVESGWCNAWIATTMAMRLTGESLYDLSAADRYRRLLPNLPDEMLS